jgi:hypothetical protein
MKNNNRLSDSNIQVDSISVVDDSTFRELGNLGYP